MNTEQTELNNAIIPTKLQKPLLEKEGLIRHGLLSQLDSGLSGKLTLISAPAGFGKTTLINQWLSQQPFEVSWLALDKQDNTHSRFLKLPRISNCPLT